MHEITEPLSWSPGIQTQQSGSRTYILSEGGCENFKMAQVIIVKKRPRTWAVLVMQKAIKTLWDFYSSAVYHSKKLDISKCLSVKDW